MLEGKLRCCTFLVVITIAFHAEAVYPGPWRSYAAKKCVWERIGKDWYQLTAKFNNTSTQQHAWVTTRYHLQPDDPREGAFCLDYQVNDLWDLGMHLMLKINSKEVMIKTSQTATLCINYDNDKLIKVTFSSTCMSQAPRIEIKHVYITTPLSTTTPLPTTNASVDPSADVGDIQYVGVVVGAICIALFTLFSCLTIISARRSNQRETQRRTIPSVSCQEDDRPDVVADNAPPSYDAVMACPDLYPPTPQDTPLGTPETTPHLSLHRRALLNQHMGSLPGSASGTPQLQRQSFTPTIASDEWDDLPDEPPPPYPGLANGSVPTTAPEDTTDDGTLDENTTIATAGVDNPITEQPASSESRSSSPEENQENPWVLNNLRNSHLRNRDQSSVVGNTAEQYSMQSRTPNGDSRQQHHDEDSHGESSSRSESLAESDSAEERIPVPKQTVESCPQDVAMRVAVV